MLGKTTTDDKNKKNNKNPLNPYHTLTTPHNQGSNRLKVTIQQYTQLPARFWDLVFIWHDFGLHCPISATKTSIKKIVGFALQLLC